MNKNIYVELFIQVEMEKEIEILKNTIIHLSAGSNKLATASINVDFIEDPQWTGFKFITKKKGAYGPTKEECEKYYSDE